MENKFSALTVDKLELCFRGSIPLHGTMEAEDKIDTDNFELSVAQSSLGGVTYLIKIKDTLEGVSDKIMGTLNIKLEKEYGSDEYRFFWLKLNNKFLYAFQNQIQIVRIINLLESELHLSLNNITNYELAYDTNFDSESVIKSYLENPEWDNLIIGKTFGVEDYIPFITREGWGTATQLTLEHMRIKGSDSKYQLYIYNKKQEMKVHGKDYIEQYYDREYDVLWRFELRCYKPQFRDFQENYSVTPKEVLEGYLFNQQGQEILLDYLSSRLLRFRRTRYDIKSAFKVLQEY